jgi:putative membrane protein
MLMRKIYTILAVLLFAAFAAPLPAEQDSATRVHVLKATDLTTETSSANPAAADLTSEEFIRQASQRTNMLTILSNLAEDRSQNEGVKAFAARLGTTHEALFKELNELANTHGVLLPNEMTQQEINVTDHLTEIVNLDFDQDYLWHILQNLRQAIANYQAASHLDNAAVKQFAATNLPKLRSELTEARRLGRQLLKTGEAGYVKSKAYPDPNAPGGTADEITTRSTEGPKGKTGATSRNNPNDEPLPEQSAND